MSETRKRALEVLQPLGFDMSVLLVVLDEVNDNVELALEQIWGFVE